MQYKAIITRQLKYFRDFPTFLAVYWLRLHLPMRGVDWGYVGSISHQGAKILHASWSKNQNKQKQYCNKFNKDLKNGPHHQIYIYIMFHLCLIKFFMYASIY